LGFFLVLGAALWLYELRRLRALYWHDVEMDHRYELSAAHIVSIIVDEEGLTLPALEVSAQTALLSLNLSATWLGHWFEPALEIVGPAGSGSVQFVERGARGRRYVNLGHLADLLGGDEARISLRGRHLRWGSQEAELLLFSRPPLDDGSVLVIASHPDDAEIAAYGLYRSLDSWIVTISAGNSADTRMTHLVSDPAQRSLLMGELRAWDSVAIPLWGGVSAESAVNLGYFTNSLAPMYLERRSLYRDEVLGSQDIEQFRRTEMSPMLADRRAESSWASLIEDLVAVLRYVQPATIVAPHPTLDASMDHKMTTVALLEALERVDSTPQSILLYTNHHATSEYYPFGGAEGLISLPPWTDEPIWARAVYSHRLSSPERIRKLYALEAQHDLRASPRYASSSPIRRLAGELGRTIQELWRDPTDTYSYFRRAARPNELFLVFAAEDVPRLRSEISAFLGDLREGQIEQRDQQLYAP
jgi:LmbE family N-acetylglucosaminyl deacetylase